MSARLSKIERQEYQLHVSCIQENMGSIRAHVVAIYTKRLYREHGSFDQFCIDVGVSRPTAYDWLNQAKVSTTVGAPISQAAARELAKVNPGHQLEVFTNAGGEEEATAEAIRNLLATLSPAAKAKIIRHHEEAGRTKARQIGARDRQKQIERLARRIRDLHAGLVDVADDADVALDAYLAVVRASTEAA